MNNLLPGICPLLMHEELDVVVQAGLVGGGEGEHHHAHVHVQRRRLRLRPLVIPATVKGLVSQVLLHLFIYPVQLAHLCRSHRLPAFVYFKRSSIQFNH